MSKECSLCSTSSYIGLVIVAVVLVVCGILAYLLQGPFDRFKEKYEEEYLTMNNHATTLLVAGTRVAKSKQPPQLPRAKRTTAVPHHRTLRRNLTTTTTTTVPPTPPL